MVRMHVPQMSAVLVAAFEAVDAAYLEVYASNGTPGCTCVAVLVELQSGMCHTNHAGLHLFSSFSYVHLFWFGPRPMTLRHYTCVYD